MKLSELIEILKKKQSSLPEDVEVEGLICVKQDGMVIFAMLEKQISAIKSAIRLFS